MQYTIDSNGIQPSKLELEAIDTKICLSLSRFKNIITFCEVSFFKEDAAIGANMLSCRLSISIIKASDFVIVDRGKTINEAFFITLARIKRNIERHLKRTKLHRMTPLLTPDDN
jgi:hypothetical protein